MGENERPRGLDVSNWQGAIDWRRVAAQGLSFAYVKATEGTTFRDPYFAENASRAAEAGLAVGAYHFFRAKSVGEARAEAEFFLGQTADFRLTLPPALDVEIPPTGDPVAFREAVLAWLEYVSNRTLRPVVYSFPAFVVQYLGDPQFERYPLWIASWDRAPSEPLGAWKNWTFWQYTCSGIIDGITGRVCLDVHRGPLDLASEETPAPPPTDAPLISEASPASPPESPPLTPESEVEGRNEPGAAPHEETLPPDETSSLPHSEGNDTFAFRLLAAVRKILLFLFTRIFSPILRRTPNSHGDADARKE
ncbi:glycoside hydrolase family 25 protein [Brockia lithotrophica]|uniref:Lysozyme n=1 Tax=Brockia lithotrophica TaxID=933949 RepID=A0A660L5Z2_9BACL|nr:glycoside hydrolase family 25 protein [Brockia lithotrophica]RKQ88634.1 GH25 family lysozyme M1 (1,4-beta-N-acetylmuramidase) [Brockia lithotrophica]